MATTTQETSTPEVDVEQVVHRATQVLGDREKALQWLGKPVRALDYGTPIAMLADVAGHARVLAILGRMEHGVL